jgi:hypothetical protein
MHPKSHEQEIVQSHNDHFTQFPARLQSIDMIHQWRQKGQEGDQRIDGGRPEKEPEDWAVANRKTDKSRFRLVSLPPGTTECSRHPIVAVDREQNGRYRSCLLFRNIWVALSLKRAAYRVCHKHESIEGHESNKGRNSQKHLERSHLDLDSPSKRNKEIQTDLIEWIWSPQKIEKQLETLRKVWEIDIIAHKKMSTKRDFWPQNWCHDRLI